MRVLHVPTVPFELTEGVARSVNELAAAQRELDVMLVSDRTPTDAGRVFCDARVVTGWAPLAMWRRAFADALRDLRPDVVHIHGGDLAPALACSPWLRGLPVVVSCYRSAAMPIGMPLRMYNLNEERANVSPRRAIAARAGALTIGRRALRSGRVGAVCTPDAAIARRFDCGPVLMARGAARVSTRSARWSDAPVVVFAGRPQAGRGIGDLVAAFRVVRETVPNARLRLMLLSGAAADEWKSELADESWAEVHTCAVPSLEDVFAECQAGVFPFRWSATLTPPLTAAEAMAVGLPIVATDVDCLSPLVADGVNGFLVEPNDPVALGKAIARVLAGPEAWQSLAEGARKTIEEDWSWDRAAEVALEAYLIALRRTKCDEIQRV